MKPPLLFPPSKIDLAFIRCQKARVFAVGDRFDIFRDIFRRQNSLFLTTGLL